MGVRVCAETECGQSVVSAHVCEGASVFLVMLVHVYNFCLPLSFVHCLF